MNGVIIGNRSPYERARKAMPDAVPEFDSYPPVRCLEAVGPRGRNALNSGQLLNPQAEVTEPDPDILCEYDRKIPMSKGFSVTASIFRSQKAADNNEKVPIVMCEHSYNNHLVSSFSAVVASCPRRDYGTEIGTWRNRAGRY